MTPSRDLSGMVFGELTAIERCGKHYRRFLWRCRCSCGKESIVDIGNLTHGHTKSCGHNKGVGGCCGRNKKDITGRKFGRLTAISELERGKGEQAKWLCQCDCGKTTTVFRNNLVREHTTSCGCYLEEMRVIANTTHGLSDTPEYKNMKGRKRKEVEKILDSEWTLEMEMALVRCFPVCVVCGGTEKLATDHILPLANGNGLRVGNATKLCIHCNSRKATKPLESLPENMRVAIEESSIAFKKYWESLLGEVQV